MPMCYFLYCTHFGGSLTLVGLQVCNCLRWQRKSKPKKTHKDKSSSCFDNLQQFSDANIGCH